MSNDTRIQKIADELATVADRLRGRFTIIGINSLDVPLPAEPLQIIVDFDEPECAEALKSAVEIAENHSVSVKISPRSEVDDDDIFVATVRGLAHNLGERPPFAKLMKKHPRLSVPRIDGWSRIGFGWISIIDRFFDVVDRVVPADVDFQVTQIKEKFGGLRLHCGAVRQEVSDFYDGVKIPPAPWEIELQHARILAEQRSFYTCEKCGQPGRLRRRSLLFTACDQHATDTDGKVAEIYEQNQVIRIDDKRYRYNPEEDEMEEFKRELEQVAGLDEYAVKSIRQNLKEQWELEDFTVLHAVKRLDWGGDGNAGYTVIVRLERADAVELFETETWACPFRSTEETLQETIQLYRELADQTENLLCKFRELKEVDNAPKP